MDANDLDMLGKRMPTEDLISRTEAIDALHQYFKDGFEEDRWWNSTHVLAALKGLPSAQPEIIRCKDCKHWDGVEACDVIDVPVWDDDFCSMAERRSDE